MDPFDPSLTPPHADLDVCVIVPCKDEAARLEATLNALARQVDFDGQPLQKNSWEVLLLINNTTDDSFDIAAQFQRAHPAIPLHLARKDFPPGQANIGHVRKLLMDSAEKRLAVRAKPFSFILSTDADTQVASDWLAQNRLEIQRGADAVGGRISLPSSDLAKLNEQTRRIHIWDDRYHVLLSWLEDLCDPRPHDPWPRHHQHFAASLAVRSEIYRRVGGLPVTECLEDVAFYQELLRNDLLFRHSPDVCVHTSGRLQGKAAVGLSHQLALWRQGSPQVLVPSVPLVKTLFLLRKRLRDVWHQVQTGAQVDRALVLSLAAACGSQTGQLEQALACLHFGSAFDSLNVRLSLERGLLTGSSQQPLEEAVRQLQSQFFAGNRRPRPASLAK